MLDKPLSDGCGRASLRHARPVHTVRSRQHASGRKDQVTGLASSQAVSESAFNRLAKVLHQLLWHPCFAQVFSETMSKYSTRSSRPLTYLMPNTRTMCGVSTVTCGAIAWYAHKCTHALPVLKVKNDLIRPGNEN